MKKILSLSTLALAGVLAFTGCSCKKGDDLPELPAARLAETGCNSDTYDVACSAITAENLYKYLGREDVVYIDLRDFKPYETQHLDGFTNVQFFADIWDQKATGGSQLFNQDYTPKYEYSVAILKGLIPQDKTVFLMCQSGARVAWMMDILELNGWDMSKIYNVGGMNQYVLDKNIGNYKDIIVEKTGKALTFKSATVTETWGGHEYATTAYVSVDANNKITNVYVTGTEYTAGSTAEWNQDTWLKAKYEYCQKLIGKTAAEVQALLGSDNKAEGADIVTGASLSSNRVLKAVVAALA